MEKLVRDLIPEIKIAKGEECRFRIAEMAEYEARLNDKLLEEANEFINDPSIEELADILEVIESIKLVKNITSEQLEAVRRQKRLQRGGFEKKIILQCKDK